MDSTRGDARHEIAWEWAERRGAHLLMEFGRLISAPEGNPQKPAHIRTASFPTLKETGRALRSKNTQEERDVSGKNEVEATFSDRRRAAEVPMDSARRRMAKRTLESAPRSLLRRSLPYLNLLIALGLSFGLSGVTRRIMDTERENTALELELVQARGELEGIVFDSQRQIESLDGWARHVQEARRGDIETYRNFVEDLRNRLEEIETKNLRSTTETVAIFRDELGRLQKRIESDLEDRPQSAAEVFRKFEAAHGKGLVLIYTEFDYYKLREGKKARRRTMAGWGSGFFVDENGYIVTNKHVVQPWKFDADLAALISMGEIRVDENSLRIACWEAGTRALDEAGEPLIGSGWDNHIRKNLTVAIQAPDHFKIVDSELGQYGSDYRVHKLDNNDLALLKVEGEGFHALPLATCDSAAHLPLQKLDPVMALGFPRGQNGLESGIAESSPSIGTVRKVEDTIHITASIIPGNSGGPLVGPEGKVVGVVTRIYSETLGICITIDHVRDLLERAKASRSDAAHTSKK
ncbi:MAG TPA: trypsin-like serine protease [Planctomycetes bacterium]|nr:trypsin-like serine protease [Planctomycetota bacterium]